MSNYKVFESDNFQKTMMKPEYKKLYFKINNYVYPLLRENPFYGPQIKRLKGDLEGLYRFRIANYRMIYKIDEDRIVVFIVSMIHRKEAYK